MSEDINIKYKDSIFRYLFKENKNFISLYKELSGKDLKEDDIKFYDTSSKIMYKYLKNDISFLTKDNRFIIMVEHQSTINKNMALRSLLYYSELLKIYIQDKNLNVYSSTAVEVPSAEMYVAYNGTRKQENEKLEMSENFVLDTGMIKVNVNIQNINYDKIKTKNEKNNFVGYTYFIDQIRKFEEKGNETIDAINKAKDECLNKGLLVEYLSRKEFLTMSAELYTIEEQIEDARNDGLEKGIEEGALKEKVKIITKLYQKNAGIDAMVEFSELSEDEVVKILEEIKATQSKDQKEIKPKQTKKQTPEQDEENDHGMKML